MARICKIVFLISGFLATFPTLKGQMFLVIGMNDCNNCQVGFTQIVNLKLPSKPIVIFDERVPRAVVKEFMEMQGLEENHGWKLADDRLNSSAQELLVSPCKGNYLVFKNTTSNSCVDLADLSMNDLAKIKAWGLGDLKPQINTVSVKEKPNFSSQIDIVSGLQNVAHIFDYQFSKIVTFEFEHDLSKQLSPTTISAQSIDGRDFCSKLQLGEDLKHSYDTSYAFLKSNKKHHPFFRAFVWKEDALWIQGEFPMVTKMDLKGQAAKQFGKTVEAIRPEFYLGKSNRKWDPEKPVLIQSPGKPDFDVDQNLPCLFVKNDLWLVPVFNSKLVGPIFARYLMDTISGKLNFLSIEKSPFPKSFPEQFKDYRFLSYKSPGTGIGVFNDIPAFVNSRDGQIVPLPEMDHEIQIKDIGQNGSFKSNFRTIASKKRGQLLEIVFSLENQLQWGVINLDDPAAWIRIEKIPAEYSFQHGALLGWGEVVHLGKERELQILSLFPSSVNR